MPDDKKMNPEIKEKWVAALRSGEYRQGRHKLSQNHDDDGQRHCCLGVLCDLLHPERWIITVPDSRGSTFEAIELEDGDTAYNTDQCYLEGGSEGKKTCLEYPPQSYLDEAGLEEETAVKIAELNDVGGMDFEDLANFIYENL